MSDLSQPSTRKDKVLTKKPTLGRAISVKRLSTLVWKESLQILRDPSSILIACVLPVILIFLFAYAVSLDIKEVRIGLVMETDTPEAQSLAASFSGTRYFKVLAARDRREVADELVAGRIRGFVVIPHDFDQRLKQNKGGLIQIITDGSQPNTADFVAGYAGGVLSTWLSSRSTLGVDQVTQGITSNPRYWFNPEIESRRALLPGAIAIVMTIIGTLLTSLVLAREWERGTMEAILSTPAGINEILLGKLIPYFILGLLATVICTLIAVVVFNVPLRGSWFALLSLSGVFLFPALGQGMLISAITKNQFLASQVALIAGFLPAFLLSGFLYEIASMPVVIRSITGIVAARYYISGLQAVFLAGDVWSLLLPNIAIMSLIGAVLFVVARTRTRKTLEG